MESLPGLTPFRSHSLRAARFTVLFTTLFTLLCSLAAAPAFAADGDGDVDDDDNGLIEIYTLAQLDLMRNDLAGTSLNGDSTGCPVSGCIGYELANDLDFDTNQDGQINDADDYWNAGAGWEPVGVNDPAALPAPVIEPFTATFDGNGHAILNLYINRSEENHVGLFGYTISPSLSNLMLAGSNMQVSGSGRVGALAGWASNTTINNILVRGTVQGGDATGALAGYAIYSEIHRCYSSADVSGGTSTGGLVGSLDSSDIDLSGATGSVSGNYQVGGLAGYQKGSITQSYATGAVTATDMYSGGLVGYQFSDASVTSSITNSYASGSAHGYRTVGGLLGFADIWSTTAVISNSYATGAVSTDLEPGGLLGSAVFSYNGNISIIDSYWDAQTTGQANSYFGGSGLTTAEMTCPQSPDDANCSLYYQNWDDTIWDFGTNEQYPVLVIDGLVHRDSDGDGVFDALDAFPNDSSRSEVVESVRALAGSGGGGSLPLWVLSAFSLLGLRRRKA